MKPKRYLRPTVLAILAIGSGSPLGRASISLLQRGDAAVAWMKTAGNDLEVGLRRVKSDGSIANFLTVVPEGQSAYRAWCAAATR